MPEFGSEHAASQHAQVKTVSPKERGTLPEHVEVVDEADVMCCANGLEPRVEIQKPAKTNIATARCGECARDRSTGFTKKLKKLGKVNFCQLRWHASGVVRSAVNDNFRNCGGR